MFSQRVLCYKDYFVYLIIVMQDMGYQISDNFQNCHGSKLYYPWVKNNKWYFIITLLTSLNCIQTKSHCLASRRDANRRFAHFINFNCLRINFFYCSPFLCILLFLASHQPLLHKYMQIIILRFGIFSKLQLSHRF